MDDKTRQYILDMSMQENRFGALYRYLAASFGISACGMWVLYYLFIAEDDISQQEHCERNSLLSHDLEHAASHYICSSGLFQESSDYAPHHNYDSY